MSRRRTRLRAISVVMALLWLWAGAGSSYAASAGTAGTRPASPGLASADPAKAAASAAHPSVFTLDNGLRVYVVEKHTAPLAAVQVWYRTGSLNERPGLRGLSHLFEHMMFRGSRRFGPEEHHKTIARMGGWNNAYTSEDVTVYVQVVPSHGIGQVLEMEADRMAHLNLEEQMLRTEIEVVKEEYRVGYENDPMGSILLEFARQYYGDHPYGYGVIGSMSDLDTVSVATCKAYYQNRYAPNNAALIVAGDVEPDSVLAWAQRGFGAIPPVRDLAPDPPPPGRPPRQLTGSTDLPVPVSGLAFRTPPAGHPDAPALEVLTELLRNRLQRRLTRESSLCLHVDVGRWPARQGGVVAFLGIHWPSIDANKVVAAIAGEIQDCLREPVSAEELDRTRNPLLLSRALDEASSDALATALGEALFVAENPERFTKRIEQLSTLTPVSLREAGLRHLAEDSRTEVRIEPEHVPLWLRVYSRLKATFHI